MRRFPRAACATLLAATGLGLVGCDADPSGGARGGTPRVIYGDDNRAEVEDVDGIDLQRQGTLAVTDWSVLRYRKNTGAWTITSNETFSSVGGYPVCDDEPFVGQNNPMWCSASLVAPDIIATAGHCVSASECPYLAFVFDFETVNGVPRMTFDNDDVYGCAEVLADQQTNSGSDWALVRLDRAVVGRTPLPYRTTGTIADGQDLFVIGHPIGLPKKYADGATVRNNATGEPANPGDPPTPGPYFVAPLDTYGGNSGSPVFGVAKDEYGNVVEIQLEGILVRGEADFVLNQNLGCAESNVCLYDECTGEDVTRITELQKYFNCPDDDLEENDTLADVADPGHSATALGDYPALYVCDADWYKVDILAGETLTARIDFVHAEGDLDLEIWDDLGNLVTSNGTLNYEVASHTSDIDQSLYVYVYGYDGAMGAYDLNITADVGGPPPTCIDDDYEDNDDQLSPTDALAPYVYEEGLAICTNDDDWYTVPVGAGDTLTATITFAHFYGDLDLELYASDGSLVDESAGTDDAEVVQGTSAVGDSFLVRVFGYEGAENTYSLELTLDVPPPPVCYDDYLEENDSQDALATVPPLDPGSYADLMVCSEDADWYRIELGPNQKLTAEISFVHADGDLDMALWDGTTTVASSQSTDDGEQAEYAPTGGGTVDVEVYGYGGAENAYEMILAVTAGDTTPPVISLSSVRYQARKRDLTVQFTTDELATGLLCDSVTPTFCVSSPLQYSHKLVLETANRPALLTATDQWGNTSDAIEIAF